MNRSEPDVPHAPQLPADQDGPGALLLCLVDEARRGARIDAALAALPDLAPPDANRWRARWCDSVDALLAIAAEDGDAILLDVADPLAALAALADCPLPKIAIDRSDDGAALTRLRACGADEHLPDADFSALLLERTLRLRDRTRALQGRIDFLAQHDVLTGLPNRKLWMRQLEHALHGAGRHDRVLAVASLVLDGFEAFVADHGQDAAEALLVTTAERLDGSLRRSDLIARAHGEEFLLMLECGADLADLAITADKLLESLRAPVSTSSRVERPTASIGIAVFPHAGITAGELLREARAACVEVIRTGGGDFRFYDAELEVVSRQSIRIERALPGAIARGELSLRYQPRIDLARGVITGAEVLLRWQSPEFGAVSPERFIPLAEASGAIGRIGAWVLDGALSSARRWLDEGLDVRLGVNVSAGQFTGGDFGDRVARALARARVPASVLELELTERVFVANVAGSKELFDALNELGVGLAVDDFGIGYSSLSYLKDFPVHALKIDKSFVDALPDAADDAAIVRAVIALGHALGLRVVAEGMERREQLEFLRAAGCDEAQGFIFGPPCDAETFTRLLRDGPPADLVA
ncbi:MAG TPA: bifunctional diguanylate cyclase/phosphodiesterase [Pseudomonadales bacterium]|nr:bifunctional diguanylate cyclase/phosphodiesterase [Pseudomonadales bacterium]